MTKRVALLHEGLVVNVAEFPNDWFGDTWGDLDAVELRAEEPVAVDWMFDGQRFSPPPLEDLEGYQSITMSQTARVTYTNTLPDAPSEITFTTNGVETTVSLTDGSAELLVTPSEVGAIRVSVNRPVSPVVITVEEGP